MGETVVLDKNMKGRKEPKFKPGLPVNLQVMIVIGSLCLLMMAAIFVMGLYIDNRSAQLDAEREEATASVLSEVENIVALHNLPVTSPISETPTGEVIVTNPATQQTYPVAAFASGGKHLEEPGTVDDYIITFPSEVADHPLSYHTKMGKIYKAAE